jgi:hypothetical protein
VEQNATPGVCFHTLAQVCVLFQAHVEVGLTTPGKQPLVVHQTLSGCREFCVECVNEVEYNQQCKYDHTYPRNVFRKGQKKVYRCAHDGLLLGYMCDECI